MGLRDTIRTWLADPPAAGATTAPAAEPVRAEFVDTPGNFGSFVAGLASKRELTVNDFEQLFKGWVFSCTSKRASALARQTRRIYRKDPNAQKGRTEVDAEHPFVKLFDTPIPTDSWYTSFDVINQVEAWLSTFGEAYIYTPRNGGKYPVQMWVLPPHLVEPKTLGKRIIDYYEWRSGAGIKRIAPEEICFLRETAPASTLWNSMTRGYSRLEAALDQVLTYTAAMDFIKGDLERGMLPPWFVTAKDRVDKKDWKVWKADLAEAFTGSAGSREPGMLQLGWDVKTVDLLENRGPVIDLMKDMGAIICSIYETPMPLITGDFGNQAPAALAEELSAAFERHTIEPQSERVDTGLTRWAQQIDPAIIIAHDPVSWQKPEEARADELHRLKTGRATVNDLRKENGEPELPPAVGDQLWIDPTLRPMDQVLAGGTSDLPAQKILLAREKPQKEDPPTPAPEPAKIETELDVLPTKSVDVDDIGDPFGNEDFADYYWARNDSVGQGQAAVLKIGIARWFKSVEAMLLADPLLKDLPTRTAATRKDLLSELSFDWGGIEELLLENTGADIEAHVERVMRMALEEIGTNLDEIEGEFSRWQQESVSESTARIVEPVATLKAEIGTLLSKVAGMSADDIASEIRTKFRYYSNARAATIAQTTATFTTGTSQLRAWDGMGVKVRWLSMRDSKTRDTHRSADNAEPDAEGYFAVGTDRMKSPAAGSQARENVGCRCTLRPELTTRAHLIAFRTAVFDPWDEMRQAA